MNNGSQVAFDRNLEFSNHNMNTSCKYCDLKDIQIGELNEKLKQLSVQNVALRNRLEILNLQT